VTVIDPVLAADHAALELAELLEPTLEQHVDRAIVSWVYLADAQWVRDRRLVLSVLRSAMTPEIVHAFARYNRWMNVKLYDTAETLGDPERKRDRGAFFKSVHGTLNHLLVADRIWTSRLNCVTPPAGFMAPGIRALDQELYADFAELRGARDDADRAITAWAATITSASVDATIRYVASGRPREYPLWWVVMQMFNHQTHHRGQITTLLSQGGHDPGSTDLFAMLNEERKRT
jgi:uncharacterized damage-inducible protein DinB